MATASKKSAQNSGVTAKPRGKPFQPGTDERRNAGGRPLNEQSITYWLREFGKLSPSQVADLFDTYAKELRKVKGDMSLFAHIAIRALMAQINEPSPGLLAQILDRTEGKVKDQVEVSGENGAPLKIVIQYADHHADPAKAPSGAGADQTGS